MKIMLRLSFLFLFLFSLFACDQNKNTLPEKPIFQKQKNESSQVIQDTATTNLKNDKVNEYSSLLSPNSGKIEWSIKEGKSFKKNECILRFDNTKQFVKISQLKATLQADFSSLILNFPPELENRKTVWADFASNLTPNKLTPKLPIEFKEEFDWISKNSTLLADYDNLILEESKMKEFFVLSKKAGKIKHWNYRKGAAVKKNSLIAEVKYK